MTTSFPIPTTTSKDKLKQALADFGDFLSGLQPPASPAIITGVVICCYAAYIVIEPWMADKFVIYDTAIYFLIMGLLFIVLGLGARREEAQ